MKTSEQTIAGADTKNQEEKYEGLTEQVMELLLQDLPVDFDIDQIEFRATQVLNRIRKLTTEKMIATRDPKSHCCGECKQPMKIKERVKNSVQGLVRYEYVRRSFHCEPCNTYEKPLDALLNIRGEYTLAVGKSMLLLGQRMPFAESSDLLDDLLSADGFNIEFYLSDPG
jgi:hypothetical protein